MLVESEFSELCSLGMRQDDELSEQYLGMETGEFEVWLTAGIGLVDGARLECFQSLITLIFS